MSEAYIPVLRLTGTAPSLVTGNRFVGFDDAQATSSGQACKGVAHSNAASGDSYQIDALGVTTVLSGAAIALGASVQTDAQGRAITLASGENQGKTLEAASGAGQLIQVLLK